MAIYINRYWIASSNTPRDDGDAMTERGQTQGSAPTGPGLEGLLGGNESYLGFDGVDLFFQLKIVDIKEIY